MYVPVLRGKMGELKGLQTLNADIKGMVYPLLRIPDPDLDYDKSPTTWKSSHEDHFLKLTKYIRKYINDDMTFFLDFEIDPDIKIKQKHYSEFMFAQLNDGHTNYIPVFSLDRKDEIGYLDSIKKYATPKKRGLCIRIPKDYAESITLHLDDILNILFELDVEKNISVIIDLEKIQDINEAKKNIENTISSLEGKLSYDNLIISSACMPENMGTFPTNEISTQKRTDWKLWQSLAKKYSLVYSDYGVLNPSLRSVNPKIMTRAGRIRYTNETEIVIFKGESFKVTPERVQNPKLAKKVLRHACYKGESYSIGNKYIFECAKGISGPGNATTWIAAEIDHHITIVMEQIANYYES
jgi:hypothetical protein